ncbi:MmpS family transport accessory protein [Nocardia asteroides]|uniref:MmpS family transport accessory protein n=1 Tax=Nocardia asteroides TaxID=1824 RepID=UPI001E46704E|nr:MmpS family transport accessory protein [Nocardia asteroides]UGT60633.1 hypothetical protein LTT61_26225 [Nocardia asteroides]
MTDQYGRPQQYPASPPQGQYPGGYGPQGYAQPPRKKATWPWILGGIALVILLGVGGCMALIAGAVNEVDKEAKREVTVAYEVRGSGGAAAVTYSGRDFDIAQEAEAPLPWSKDVTIDGLGKYVSLTAQSGADGEELSCRILVDGRVLSEQTSNGPFSMVSCSGDAGGE